MDLCVSFFNIKKEMLGVKYILVKKIKYFEVTDLKKDKVRIHMTPFEVCNSIITLLVAIFIFVSVMWMGGTLIGYGGLSYDTWFSSKKPSIVISESMTPTIAVNGLLMIENKSFEDLQIGDIIMFQTKEYGLVTHRIVHEVRLVNNKEIKEKGLSTTGFRTKGDNNKLEDSWIVTSEMYKGTVTEIYNEFAPFITILFGDLDNINIGKLLLGYIILALILVGIIYLIKVLYNYICIYHFLKKSEKKGAENVIEEYYPYLKEELDINKILEVFNSIGNEKGFFNHLKYRYNIMKLHHNLLSTQRLKNRIDYRYSKIMSNIGRKED